MRSKGAAAKAKKDRTDVPMIAWLACYCRDRWHQLKHGIIRIGRFRGLRDFEDDGPLK